MHESNNVSSVSGEVSHVFDIGFMFLAAWFMFLVGRDADRILRAPNTSPRAQPGVLDSEESTDAQGTSSECTGLYYSCMD